MIEITVDELMELLIVTNYLDLQNKQCPKFRLIDGEWCYKKLNGIVEGIENRRKP